MKKNTMETVKSLNENELPIGKVRIEIPVSQVIWLYEALKGADFNENDYEKGKLLEYMENGKIIEYSAKKGNATEKATAARTAVAKKKIDNAINILRMEGRPITHYAISKTSGVAFQTVKKYVTL